MYYPEDVITDRNERFFSTEIIREAILKMYQVIATFISFSDNIQSI